MNTYCFMDTFYAFSSSVEDAMEKFSAFCREYYKDVPSITEADGCQGDIYTDIRDLMKYIAFNNNTELCSGRDERLFVVKLEKELPEKELYLSFNKCLYGYDVYAFILNEVSTSYVHQKVITHFISSLDGGLISNSKIKEEINRVLSDAQIQRVSPDNCSEMTEEYPKDAAEFYDLLDKLMKGKQMDKNSFMKEEQTDKNLFFKKVRDVVVFPFYCIFVWFIWRIIIRPIFRPSRR